MITRDRRRPETGPNTARSVAPNVGDPGDGEFRLQIQHERPEFPGAVAPLPESMPGNASRGHRFCTWVGYGTSMNAS